MRALAWPRGILRRRVYLIVPLGIATILALNAALVEEMAAAASSLNAQASDLVQAVAVFKDYREGF